jgi:hypothetical protein
MTDSFWIGLNVAKSARILYGDFVATTWQPSQQAPKILEAPFRVVRCIRAAPSQLVEFVNLVDQLISVGEIDQAPSTTTTLPKFQHQPKKKKTDRLQPLA